MERLKHNAAWVTIWFPDGTAQTIHTSLNEKYLKSVGATPRAGYLFDLEQLKYVKFRDDAERIEISDDKPQFEWEVMKFASRFI